MSSIFGLFYAIFVYLMYFLKRVVSLKFANKKSLKSSIYWRFSDFHLMERVTGIGPVIPTLPKLRTLFHAITRHNSPQLANTRRNSPIFKSNFINKKNKQKHIKIYKYMIKYDYGGIIYV